MSDSVKKAFQLIDCLSRSPGKCSLAEISRALKLNKTTVFRYLETLVGIGVIEKSEKEYSLGMRLFELGSQVPVKQLVVDRIHPFLADLCAEINETVNLAQLQGDHLVYLDKIESRRSLQMRSRIGDHLPLYCTGLGKAILSLLPSVEFERLIAGIDLRPYTSSTITDRGELSRQIQEVRNAGCAFDREELESGLTCVAVPLLLSKYEFKGAVSISIPAVQFADEFIQGMTRRLIASADAIMQYFKEAKK